MDETVDRFDLIYQESKTVIRDNLNFLSNREMAPILAWVSKLEEAPGCPKAKAIRNEYARYLAYQLSREILQHPFTEEPPEGNLQPLNIPLDSQEQGPSCPFRQENTCLKEPPCAKKEDVNLSKFSEWPLPTTSPIIRHSASPCQRRGSPLASMSPGSIFSRKCPTDTAPCPIPQEPAPIPDGYLSKSTEEDDSPFAPQLSCTQENQYKLSRLAAEVCEATELFEFMTDVAPHTCDLGEAMQSVITEELAQFKEFVKSVYLSRMADTQELLTAEHIKLKDRYDEYESNVLNKADVALRAIKLTLPQFNYDTYKNDPEYLYYMLKDKMAIEETDDSPQIRTLRAKAQKKTWLNEEAQRIEKDNMERLIEMRELNAQVSALSKTYNSIHNHYNEMNKSLENSAAQLRIRHDENQKQIDVLIDQINTPNRTY